jgi:hypothetical protein
MLESRVISKSLTCSSSPTSGTTYGIRPYNPPAERGYERRAHTLSEAEGLRIALERAERYLPFGDLRDEGDIHAELLTGRGQYLFYEVRSTVIGKPGKL